MDTSDRTAILFFCPGCFASSEDGSWSHVCDGTHCFNCGAGSTVELPRWAINSIRKQASWVGKRYYPHEEDQETADELRLLREIAPRNPDDTAELDEKAGYWRVTRRYPGKGSVTVAPIHATTRQGALAAGQMRLRYCPPSPSGRIA